MMSLPELQGFRLLAVDLPGHGLSDPVRYEAEAAWRSDRFTAYAAALDRGQRAPGVVAARVGPRLTGTGAQRRAAVSSTRADPKTR
jgi:pimeloyl-ACP methyl ester carboxylesterase